MSGSARAHPASGLCRIGLGDYDRSDVETDLEPDVGRRLTAEPVVNRRVGSTRIRQMTRTDGASRCGREG